MKHLLYQSGFCKKEKMSREGSELVTVNFEFTLEKTF